MEFPWNGVLINESIAGFRLSPEYPYHDGNSRVTRRGRIGIGKRKISLSRAFAGQYVGVTEIDDDVLPVSFMGCDQGFMDRDAGRFEPVGENPFNPKVLPMSPEWTYPGRSGTTFRPVRETETGLCSY